MSIFDVLSSAKELGFKEGSLGKTLARTGRSPSVELFIKPIEANRDQINIKTFLNYEFNSSILIPVDQFSFTFVAPNDSKPPTEKLRSGDIAVLKGNNIQFSTGIIDTVSVKIHTSEGEEVTVTGRDLMGQLEDNDAIDAQNKPIYGENITIKQAVASLAQNTRISSNVILQDASKKPWLFATEPGESKLAALMRFLEPLNVLPWMDASGKIKIGRPNMSQDPRGSLYIVKSERKSNVISMQVTKNSTKVPNVIVPIWSGQENVSDRIPSQQSLNNSNKECKRLRDNNHKVIKTIVVSIPSGDSAQDLSSTNQLTAGGQNLLQAYGKRELARQNMNVLIVEIIVAGHYNDLGEPYVIDTVYNVICDRAGINEKMYLFEVQYRLSEESGQQSILKFCQLGTIVSDIKVF